MRQKLAALVVVAAAVGVGLAVGASWRRPRGGDAGAERVAELDARVWPLAQAIDEAADYLVRVNGADGRFEYVRFVDGREGPAGQYNVLRHAGSIYALSDYVLAAGGRSGDVGSRDGAPAIAQRASETASRASAYLVSRYVRPLGRDPELLAVWSDPREEAGSSRLPAAKLGGAGLALVALASEAGVDRRVREAGAGGADAGAPTLETMRGLARFICFMQQPSGAFYAKYEEEQGYVRDAESLYYPGEAILALTMLYEIDRDDRWRDAAARGIAQLIASRRGAKTLPNDHWLMIAIDRFLPHHTGAAPATKAEMLEHAIALGRAMMKEQADALATTHDPNVAGAFDTEGRTTPAATRLEGLLALEHAVAESPEHAAFRDELRVTIRRGVAFLRRSQVRDGVARGGVPRSQSGAAVGGDVPDAGAGEARQEQEVRIDYVQHALSALLRYAATCAGRTDCPPEGRAP
ncbi:MAG: hypothetical protein KF764_28700 [Labilithrix sp.]|nr:hypothetical protein [Labilithrix sp.]